MWSRWEELHWIYNHDMNFFSHVDAEWMNIFRSCSMNWRKEPRSSSSWRRMGKLPMGGLSILMNKLSYIFGISWRNDTSFIERLDGISRTTKRVIECWFQTNNFESDFWSAAFRFKCPRETKIFYAMCIARWRWAPIIGRRFELKYWRVNWKQQI